MTDRVTHRAGLPLLLTVEEAGAVLRVGRTKAYAMAREWRVTEGRSGLPVIDLGNVLRVPRRALEEMIGVELTDLPNGDRVNPHQHSAVDTEPAPRTASPRTRTRRRVPPADDEQLGLFAVRPPAS